MLPTKSRISYVLLGEIFGPLKLHNMGILLFSAFITPKIPQAAWSPMKSSRPSVLHVLDVPAGRWFELNVSETFKTSRTACLRVRTVCTELMETVLQIRAN